MNPSTEIPIAGKFLAYGLSFCTPETLLGAASVGFWVAVPANLEEIREQK
jgi:hypothetical protein